MIGTETNMVVHDGNGNRDAHEDKRDSGREVCGDGPETVTVNTAGICLFWVLANPKEMLCVWKTVIIFLDCLKAERKETF